jgi:signal transduction histidine kinase
MSLSSPFADSPYSSYTGYSIALSRRITHRSIALVLVAGFALVTFLLLAAAGVAVQNNREIQSDASDLIREQALTARLMNQMRVEQTALNAVFYQLIRDPEDVDKGELIRQLETAGDSLGRLARNASSTPESKLWQQLDFSAQLFAAESKRLIMSDHVSDASIRDLFKLHEAVAKEVRDLAAASGTRAQTAESHITTQAQELMDRSILLLAGCFALAMLGALLTLRFTFGLLSRMETQAHELSRVSWQMLQGQEDAARRFSHELHDELGQSLMAMKANLTAFTPENLAVRRADSLALVDEAIANVRELSQLLRPVILDDFGLDASLKWLADKFSERTGIQVRYTSSFSGRLADETETHLFRIAQEALTNVARHSGASKVDIDLSRRDGYIWLSIADNGKGLQRNSGAPKPSVGMVGMRARARHAGGDFRVESPATGGLALSVWVPLMNYAESHAIEKIPHPVGR